MYDMKKLIYFLSIIFVLVVITWACYPEKNTDPLDEIFVITLSGLKPATISISNGRMSAYDSNARVAAPSDQDTLYVSFRLYRQQTNPEYQFKLSPIPDSYDFILPKVSSGYDVFVCTYPNKLLKTAETWDMPKHLWLWHMDDVGSPPVGTKIQVELQRLSSNLIIKAKDGQTIPSDYGIESIRLMIDAVFLNYQPINGVGFGLYERKWIDMWPTSDNIFEWNNVCMGLYQPYDSLGTFEFIIERQTDNSWPYDYIKFAYQFQVIKGKTTTIEVDLQQIGTANWSKDFIWKDEEENITIIAGG